jgi:predicted dehydrogenase
LSTANIGLEKVIPAMQEGEYCEMTAISSQSLEFGKVAAEQLGIAQVYGSFEELLADDNIDAVYIPLPNHLHVP